MARHKNKTAHNRPESWWREHHTACTIRCTNWTWDEVHKRRMPLTRTEHHWPQPFGRHQLRRMAPIQRACFNMLTHVTRVCNNRSLHVKALVSTQNHAHAGKKSFCMQTNGCGGPWTCRPPAATLHPNPRRPQRYLLLCSKSPSATRRCYSYSNALQCSTPARQLTKHVLHKQPHGTR